ncbi:MAG: glutathione-dependent formaldehyde dehydrogenase [Anaerolineae bacterium]|nr:glutathione-dependent formaldehyde dehydrogenase [Anaerolineae bacterium]
MKALCWIDKHEVRVEDVPDPRILNPRDAIVKVTAACICGSDLHLYDGVMPTMEKGDILGHEFVGEVVEVGPKVKNLKPGDRVVVPFAIACGNCWYCKHGLWSLCDNSNPNAWMAEKLFGFSPAGLFGYSHLTGGYAGGQAQYVRVPFADVGPYKLPDSITDDQAVMLADVFPTGYMAAENCNIHQGDIVAVWGCGSVGQFTIRSAFLLGAHRVIAMDDTPERLALAQKAGAETLNINEVDVLETLREMTGGRGPDACVDAVGLEAHGMEPDALLDRVKTEAMMTTDRGHVLRQVFWACRKGGTVSIPGVYGGFVDKLPMGAAMNKGLTIRTGQTHVHRYIPKLVQHVERGEIDPSVIVTHVLPLDQAPHGYQIFKDHQDGCIKVVLTPHASGNGNGNGKATNSRHGHADVP